MKKIIFILFIYLLLISNVLAGEKSPANYIVNNCKFSELCTITYAELSVIVQDNVTKNNIQQFSITTEKDFHVIYKLTDIGINYIVPSETEFHNNNDKIYHNNDFKALHTKLNWDKVLDDSPAFSAAVKVEIEFHLNMNPLKIDMYSVFSEKNIYIVPIIYYITSAQVIKMLEENITNGVSTKLTYDYTVGDQLGIISESSYIKLTLGRDSVDGMTHIYLRDNRITDYDKNAREIIITYQDLKNLKYIYTEIPPVTTLKYSFSIPDYYKTDEILELFLVKYRIIIPVFIGNCALSGKVKFANEKATDEYIFFHIAADIKENPYSGFHNNSSQYQKLNDDGTFLLKSIPDYEWRPRTSENIIYYKLHHTLNAFDLDGNKGEIVDKKLVCEPIFEIEHKEYKKKI